MSTLKSSAEDLTLNADGANNDIILQSNGSTKVTLDGQNSRLGIGTASPSSTLHIEDNSNYTLKVSKSGSNIHLASFASNGSAALGIAVDDSSNLVRLNSEGSNDSLQLEVADGTIGLKIDSTGAVTKPLQPAFSAVNASTQSNIAVNTAVTVVFGTEIFDNNADFSSNTFTAPVTGKYQLNASIRMGEVDNAASYYNLYLVTSNRSYFTILDPRAHDQDSAYHTLNISVLADMDASDTASLQIYQANGDAQMDISSSAASTFFQGHLVA